MKIEPFSNKIKNQVIEAYPDKVVIWPITNSIRYHIKGVVRPFI